MSYTDLIASCSESRIFSGLVYAALSVGVFKLTTLILSYSAVLFDLFILPAVNFKKYGAKQGCWAVVTGASDGIGREYSYQLAKRGLNVLLVSRTLSKLEILAAEIESKYKVKTKVLSFDASNDLDKNYKSLDEALMGLPVTVLVNNVGQSHSIPVSFLETSEKEMMDIITINNIATLKITKTILPNILKSSKEHHVRGLILTMGSFGGLIPSPLLATYSGSKAFLQSWSAALAGELAENNVDVQLVISYLVTSAMSKIRRSSMSIPNPKVFVGSVLRSVGRRGGAQERFATATPFWAHALMHWWIENTVGVYSKIANTINLTMHKSIRARALKKAARLATKHD